MKKNINMNEMLNIVVVPLYQSTPNEWEKKSFEQCCKVLGRHPICIATHSNVTIKEYQAIASKYNIKLRKVEFNSEYFANIFGYNRLMLDKSFYQRFRDYQYMLVYQLDAWVFCDELEEWCKKGYDYIGAPWVEKNEEGNIELAGVGNGGFSLRRVQHFIDVLSYKGPVKDGKKLHLEATLKNRLYRFFYSLGYQNTIAYYKKDETLYEDIFLSIFLNDTKLRANIPDAETAAHFAFEKSPSFLYSITKQLPFGCHAWLKYEYDTFWKYHILTSL